MNPQPTAAAPLTGRLTLISYNVAGLPVPRQYDEVWRLPWQRANSISRQIGQSAFTVFAAQEDFNTHQQLAKYMSAFPYQSCTSGNVPQGDGLNLFSKLPIYNVIRVPWQQYHGVFDCASDALSNKGFMVCTLELAPGLTIHVYNIHTGAADDENSIAARKDNFRQLAAFMNAYSKGRPLLVTGDFNCTLRREESQLCQCLMEPAGLTDLWALLHNGGRCSGFDEAPPEDSTGDALDRVMFRDGGGVTFRPLTHDLVQLYDRQGVPLSDHATCQVELEYHWDGSPQMSLPLEPPAPYSCHERLSRFRTHAAKALRIILEDIRS